MQYQSPIPNPQSLTHRDTCAIQIWLITCAALIALMVVIGGYTRLSGSGLSITEWKPIHGTLPPMNADQWQEEFAAYQQSPQYQKVNNGMSLDDFKTIFWPEFIHRLVGRAIGIVFFLPLVIFALRRSLTKRFGWRLAAIFALGGVQGLIGWLMVKSGLQNDPQVSPIRLALHLSTAFALFALILWATLDVAKGQISKNKGQSDSFDIWHLSFALWFTLLCLQIILGAFMAGLHGGLIYNTWPTMNGQWIPADLFAATPWYANVTLIQFAHRKLAIFLFISYLAAWLLTPKTRLNTALAATLFAQFTLGIATLLNQAPLALALAHQMVGLLLFCLAVIMLHNLSPRRMTGSGVTRGSEDYTAADAALPGPVIKTG